MLPWFFRSPQRLAEERQGVEQLLQTSGAWLKGCEWILDNGLRLDIVISVHSYDYELSVEFPALYPEAPASVRPRSTTRLSQHQYGAGGVLCLEWGPDNWHAGVNAAALILSAYKLLSTENPLGSHDGNERAEVASRHSLTLGQETRSAHFRWFASEAVLSFLAGRTCETAGTLTFSIRKVGGVRVLLVHEATDENGQKWVERGIPQDLPYTIDYERYPGAWVKTDRDRAHFEAVQTLEQLQLALGSPLDGRIGKNKAVAIERMDESLVGIVVNSRQGVSLFIRWSDDSLTRCAFLKSGDANIRSTAGEAEALTARRVGIVGVGSLGSKVAVSLARMGVGKFYLIDHDILFPENLCRHGLDWQYVGAHKVDALVSYLQRVRPSVVVETSEIHLTGQESNAIVARCCSRLAECDLIVDATASSRVFNLLAGIAVASRKTLVWGEVFAGGIGGLVARSQPGLDPSPHDVRRSYLDFCSRFPPPPELVEASSYDDLSFEGTPLIAADADIDIVAAHLARIVTHGLFARAAIVYPYSSYLIGLQKAWVFEQAFDTVPLAATEATTVEDVHSDTVRSNQEFLADLLMKRNNEATPTE